MKLYLIFPIFALLLTGCTSIEVKPKEVSSCQYEELVYRIGEIFPAGDNVNTCECKSDGSVDCTTEPVPKNPAECELATDCEALDLETFCQNGNWACVENTCEFNCDLNGML